MVNFFYSVSLVEKINKIKRNAKKEFNKLKKDNRKILYLNSKEPLFFENLGFEYEQKNINFFKNCLNCPEYNVTCFPKVMRYQID